MVDGCPATQRTSQTVQPETPRCWPDIYKHPSLKRRCISSYRYHETHRTTSLHCRDILLDGMLIKCHPTSATAGGRGHPYCHQRACSPDVHTTIDTDVDTTTYCHQRACSPDIYTTTVLHAVRRRGRCKSQGVCGGRRKGSGGRRQHHPPYAGPPARHRPADVGRRRGLSHHPEGSLHHRDPGAELPVGKAGSKREPVRLLHGSRSGWNCRTDHHGDFRGESVGFG